MNLDSKVGNEYLKIKLLGISTSALIMMLSNGVYASNEVPTASLNNNNELNNGTEIVQEIDSDDDSLDIDDLLNKDTTGENDNDVSDRCVEKAMGITGNYRSPQADRITVREDGK